MSNEITGWTPVATVEEAEGVEMWEVAEQINEQLDGTDADVVFLDEVHGPIHLAFRHDNEHAEWERCSKFDYRADAAIDATDDLANHVGQEYRVVSEIGAGNDRHLVYTGGE